MTERAGCPVWLLGLALWAGAAGAHATDLEAVMASLSRVGQIEAVYTETLESALLATVITSQGRLRYQAPDRIIKTGADGDAVEIDGDRILIRRGSEQREIAVTDHPGVERLVAALRAVFAGDLGRLQRDYRLEFGAAAGHWDLTLYPLDRQLLSLFEQIRIRGQGAVISRIEIDESNGDRRSTRYQVLSLQPAAAPAVSP